VCVCPRGLGVEGVRWWLKRGERLPIGHWECACVAASVSTLIGPLFPGTWRRG
jgi:hypothetical protein